MTCADWLVFLRNRGDRVKTAGLPTPGEKVEKPPLTQRVSFLVWFAMQEKMHRQRQIMVLFLFLRSQRVLGFA